MDTYIKDLCTSKVVIIDGLLDLNPKMMVDISKQISSELYSSYYHLNADDYQNLLDMVQEEGNE